MSLVRSTSWLEVFFLSRELHCVTLSLTFTPRRGVSLCALRSGATTVSHSPEVHNTASPSLPAHARPRLAPAPASSVSSARLRGGATLRPRPPSASTRRTQMAKRFLHFQKYFSSLFAHVRACHRHSRASPSKFLRFIYICIYAHFFFCALVIYAGIRVALCFNAAEQAKIDYFFVPDPFHVSEIYISAHTLAQLSIAIITGPMKLNFCFPYK